MKLKKDFIYQDVNGSKWKGYPDENGFYLFSLNSSRETFLEKFEWVNEPCPFKEIGYDSPNKAIKKQILNYINFGLSVLDCKTKPTVSFQERVRTSQGNQPHQEVFFRMNSMGKFTYYNSFFKVDDETRKRAIAYQCKLYNTFDKDGLSAAVDFLINNKYSICVNGLDLPPLTRVSKFFQKNNQLVYIGIEGEDF